MNLNMSPKATTLHLADTPTSAYSINTPRSPDLSPSKERMGSSASADYPFSVYTDAVDSTITMGGFGKNKVVKLDQLNVFKCVMITNWDNILGPQVFKCWIRSDDENSEKLISYVNMHVLTGDMDESNSSSRDRERKLLFIPEQKIIILGIIFNVSSRLYRAKLYCLSLVFPLENSKQASQVTDLYSFLYKSCTGVKNAIKDSSVSNSRLNDHIGKMIVKLDTTVYNLLHFSLDQIKRPLRYFGDGTHKDAYDFLKLVYQAVLQCAGFSVITGHRRQWQKMDQMSLLISYIIPANEKCVTMFPTELHTEFTSHVFLQTIVYDDDSDDVLRSVSSFKTYFNRFPIAVIDVTKRTVKVTASLESFCNKKMKEEVVTRHGKFVEKIVSRMISFAKNEEFLTRIGAMAMQEIICKADVFKNLFTDEFSYSNNSCTSFIATKKVLKWNQYDCDIFVAWACRDEPDLKKHFFVKDYSNANLEQSELLPVFGRGTANLKFN